MSTPTVDPFDELASMFISHPTRGAGTTQTQVADACAVAIDLLLVGHLPVRGGLWITPYADAVARSAGPVGLVRLDGPEPTVQLLRGNRGPANTRSRDLLEAIDGMADGASRWVVRPCHEAAPEDLLACSINRITILSSADEAAVVAAYQVIKSWVNAANDAGIDLPPIDVAIVGADEQRATIAFERIRRTAEARLDRTLTLACILSQIDANIEATSFLAFPDDEGITAAEVIAQLQLRPPKSPADQWTPPSEVEMDQLADTGSVLDGPDDDADFIDDLTEARQIDFNPAARGLAEIPPPHHKPEASPRVNEPGARTHEPGAQATGPTTPGINEPEASAPGVRPSPTSHSREAAHAAAGVAPATWNPKPVEQHLGGKVSTLRLGPKPATTMESKPGATQRASQSPVDQQSLAKHVAGLRALKPRCPGHETIEIAVDGRGDLHLLAREESLRELAVVRRWALAHRELLRMACPNDRISETAATHLHVFAPQPLAVCDLHESDYHLHVLAPVEVEGRTAWYCAPLNQPD